MQQPKSKTNGEPFPPKFRKALTKLYKENGVGRTAKQRRAYWFAKEPYTTITHIDMNNDAQVVKVMELCWLTHEFPQDFQFC